MSEEHPNVSLISYFNPLLPEIQGDYVGLSGIQSFFAKIGAITDGTFRVERISETAVGDELVVVQTRNFMTIQGQSIATDVVIVWRVVDGRVVEVWDIPSIYTSPTESHG